ncbi:hypothetical protein [Actinoalloteichus hymeniacidonis]|uniref:Prenyltransferase n=1 Tax=Actinoalloteichus hymeniacidonis TaxID=340345 RepID=A0AAC9HTT8_9PSEU|nr:hypothetical protein [Actinoalloteichus hymeniacidonis]AOS64991.1 hypothetical protein TL08_21000 [Actinoalloteichus hymeniacidonis]MBB5906933.1 hypothetical protein [Actinoalloteichus hymeniacidonis]
MRDLTRISEFITTHARLLDRRRFALLIGAGPEEIAGALAALACYRNPDGGYGWGLEPDLRSSSSQPVSALHAFEVFEGIGGPTSDASALCDWLASITLADGGLPFGLPISDSTGCAPYFVDTDPTESSLHMTSMLAAIAHRIGRFDPGVRDHPWLATATSYALQGARRSDGSGHALESLYLLHFLDAVHEVVPEAAGELRRLGGLLPSSGVLPVGGGLEDEALHPLDFAPLPDRPIRALFADSRIESELDRLAADQREDGGWSVDWASFSTAGALEWRGWATVRAVRILAANGRD